MTRMNRGLEQKRTFCPKGLSPRMMIELGVPIGEYRLKYQAMWDSEDAKLHASKGRCGNNGGSGLIKVSKVELPNLCLKCCVHSTYSENGRTVVHGSATLLDIALSLHLLGVEGIAENFSAAFKEKAKARELVDGNVMDTLTRYMHTLESTVTGLENAVKSETTPGNDVIIEEVAGLCRKVLVRLRSHRQSLIAGRQPNEKLETAVIVALLSDSRRDEYSRDDKMSPRVGAGDARYTSLPHKSLREGWSAWYRSLIQIPTDLSLEKVLEDTPESRAWLNSAYLDAVTLALESRGAIPGSIDQIPRTSSIKGDAYENPFDWMVAAWLQSSEEQMHALMPIWESALKAHLAASRDLGGVWHITHAGGYDLTNKGVLSDILQTYPTSYVEFEDSSYNTTVHRLILLDADTDQWWKSDGKVMKDLACRYMSNNRGGSTRNTVRLGDAVVGDTAATLESTLSFWDPKDYKSAFYKIDKALECARLISGRR